MVHGVSQSSRDKIINPTVATNLLSNRDSRTVSQILSVQDQRRREVVELKSTRHHQLKNFISTTKENIIYYASQHEIYALHISKQKRELIASLPWKPQCLDAGYGWICVGGSDSGRCAFVNTHDECPKGGGDGSIPHHVEVDALLPLELDPESRLLAHNFLQQRNQTFASAASTTSVAPRGKAEVHIHEVGGSIVNSVTIHRLRSDREGFEDEIVAVLT